MAEQGSLKMADIQKRKQWGNTLMGLSIWIAEQEPNERYLWNRKELLSVSKIWKCWTVKLFEELNYVLVANLQLRLKFMRSGYQRRKDIVSSSAMRL